MNGVHIGNHISRIRPTFIPFWFHSFRLFDGRNHIACSSIIYNISVQKKTKKNISNRNESNARDYWREKPMKKRNWKWFEMNWPNNTNKSNSIFCSQLLVGALQIFHLLLLLLLRNFSLIRLCYASIHFVFLQTIFLLLCRLSSSPLFNYASHRTRCARPLCYDRREKRAETSEWTTVATVDSSNDYFIY